MFPFGRLNIRKQIPRLIIPAMTPKVEKRVWTWFMLRMQNTFQNLFIARAGRTKPVLAKQAVHTNSCMTFLPVRGK